MGGAFSFLPLWYRMSLQDIQLKIILDVKGQSALKAVNTALQGTHKAADTLLDQSKRQQSINWSQVRSWSDLSKQLGNVETGYDAVWRALFRVQQVGRDLQRAGMAGIGVLKKSVDEWGEYEFILNRAAGALLENRDLYPQLSKGILDVAKQVKLWDPKDVAKATYYWASTTGQQVKTTKDLKVALAGVTPILKAAALTETDYETAIKGVYSIIKQYKLSLSDTTDVTEKLMLMTQRTALEFPDLIESFKYVGPLANSLKISFDEVATTLGILGDLGQRGSQAGRGLGMFLTQMVRPAPKGIKAMNELFKATMGVKNGYNKLVFPKGKFIGLEKFTTLLAKATMNLTDKQKLNYITSIVGTQNAARQIIPLIDAQISAIKRGTSVWDDSKYSLLGAHKAFEDSFQYLSDSWKGLVGGLKNTVYPIILQVGKAVADTMKPIIKNVTKAVDVFGAWLNENPKLVDFAVKVLAVGSALAAVLGAALTFGASLAGINLALKMLGIKLGGIAAPVLMLGAIFATVVGAIWDDVGGIRSAITRLVNVIASIFGEASKEMGGFGLDWAKVGAILKGGVIEVVKGLADGINWVADALIKLNNDPVGHQVLMAIAKGLMLYSSALVGVKAMNLAVGGIGTAFMGLKIAAPILKPFVLGLTGLPAIAKAAGAGVGVGIKLITGALSFLLAHPVVAAIAAIIAVLFLAWENNWFGIRDIVANVVNWLVNVALPWVEKFINDAIAFLSGIVAAIGPAWDGLVATIQSVLSSIQTALAGAFDPIYQFFNRLAQPIRELVERYFPSLVNGVTSIVNTITSVFGYLWGVVNDVWNTKILPTVQGVIDAFITKFNEIMTHVGPAVDSMIVFFQTLAETVINVLTMIGGFLGDVFGFITEVIGNFVGFLQTIFWPIWDATSTIILAVLGVIGTALRTAFEFFMNNLFKPFGEFVIRIIGIAFETIGGIVKGVMTMLQAVIETALDIIKGIFDFFTAILKGDWGAAWDAIAGIVQSVFRGIVKFVGGILEVIGSIISGGLQLVAQYFSSAAQTILGILGSLVGAVGTVAGNIINALVTGITGMIGWVVDQITGFVGGIIDAIRDALGIASPSRVMLAIGKNIVQGLWNGIVGLKDWIVGKLTDFVKNVIPGPIKDVLGIQSPSKVTAQLGAYVVKGLAEGIRTTDDAYRAMVSTTTKLADIAAVGSADIGTALSATFAGATGSMSIASDNTQTIRLEVQVTSPDGSVSQLDQQQLAALLNGSELVRALEHMASVG